MGPLRELLAIDHRQALEFFVLRLQDVSEPTVDRQELLYNASLLAHYAQVSTQPDVDVPAPANLSAVFDHFVADTTLLHDRLMMETAGAQCLLLAGFFEDQMRPTAQHPLVCRVGREFLQPGRPSRAVSAQSPAARRHREALRALASAPRAAESRAAGPALSADPARATRAHVSGYGTDTSESDPRHVSSSGVEIMNVRPLHDRIIIQRLEEGEQKVGGIIIPDTAKEKPQQGKVIAAGTGKVRDDGTRQPPDVKAGDLILFGKYSGQEIKLDGEDYLIMREDEVLGVIEGGDAKKKK